jgi:hypothetical protein
MSILLVSSKVRFIVYCTFFFKKCTPLTIVVDGIEDAAVRSLVVG